MHLERCGLHDRQCHLTLPCRSFLGSFEDDDVPEPLVYTSDEDESEAEEEEDGNDSGDDNDSWDDHDDVQPCVAADDNNNAPLGGTGPFSTSTA